jgi:hypothetical protein
MTEDEDMARPPDAGTGPDPELLSDRSITDEAHPDVHPQSPAELAAKIKAEMADGDGVIDKARRAFHEMDRDIGGEYERREDPTAPKPHPDAPGSG